MNPNEPVRTTDFVHTDLGLTRDSVRSALLKFGIVLIVVFGIVMLAPRPAAAPKVLAVASPALAARPPSRPPVPAGESVGRAPSRPELASRLR